MGSGYLILSSHTSPIDLLFLNYLASPQYTKLSLFSKDQTTNFFIGKSPSGALKGMLNPWAFSFEEISKEIKKDSLKELLLKANKEKKGPIALFFEVLSL